MKRKKILQTGFTLIELLIVVAIIGILSTLLMTNFIGVRQRARDAQRKSDLRQMQSALELYRSDQGSYPSVASAPYQLTTDILNTQNTTYMRTIPSDPLGTGVYNGGNYYYSSDGTKYTLAACAENIADPQAQNSSPGGNGCSSGYFFIYYNP